LRYLIDASRLKIKELEMLKIAKTFSRKSAIGVFLVLTLVFNSVGLFSTSTSQATGAIFGGVTGGAIGGAIEGAAGGALGGYTGVSTVAAIRTYQKHPSFLITVISAVINPDVAISRSVSQPKETLRSIKDYLSTLFKL
jgi:hypothetical protein